MMMTKALSKSTGSKAGQSFAPKVNRANGEKMKF